jgi:hypothetical protein
METFGEVQGNPDLAAAQQQALTGGAGLLRGGGLAVCRVALWAYAGVGGGRGRGAVILILGGALRRTQASNDVAEAAWLTMALV